MSGDVTYQALERLTHMPEETGNQGDVIAGQKYYDVEITGGDISGVAVSGITLDGSTITNCTITGGTISSLSSPLAIASGGTGQITANTALNALLPSQTGQSGKALKTDGTNTSWSTDTDTGITQLTGDVTAGPGSGSQAATLATVNSNVGTFGSSTSIPTLTVTGKGLVTAASGNVVIAPAGTLTGATLAAGVTASSLTSVGTLTSLTMGGDIALAAHNITMTGSLGATGARLTKGWFTDLQVTNAISGSITGNAATVTTNANLTGSIVTSTGNATTVNMSPITNSLSGDVNLNNTGTYFDGPSVAQGTSGTWFVSGTVSLSDQTNAAGYNVKLWDGTTVIASARATAATGIIVAISLSGYIVSPAGNLRISVEDNSNTTAKMIFNGSGNSKDCTITAIRIAN